MRSHHFSGKLCKLIQHVKTQPKNYAGEDIAFCPKDFPFIRENDVVEIYNPEEDSQRLLLKVTKGSLRDDFAHKDAISIEQSIASQFQLKNFPDVMINKIDVASAELDSLELTFKDQYLGRSEMWRLKKSLVNTCLYMNKRIEFASSTIRCQVQEMWNHGQIVYCGIVTANTKIVFRSSSSMVYLFIQMSSEMWDFDIHGDLYFEKAVNGFLTELFTKWKKNGSNHEVTIVLFSRLYYVASSPEQFPESVRQCLQIDYRGRFYEDYYRVAVQNEKYDDWSNILTHLKHLFVEYQSSVMNAHAHGHKMKLPMRYISSAAQGNVLEVLNMSLNVFEKHYMDRSFDRTGQLSVIITPGVGVFEVDRELTNVTMQRIIDNGVGSDLVCVGEQPLHAVPLLKFHNKNVTQSTVEDYSMPHWINQSFYSSNKKVGYSSFVPRIKLPTRSLTKTGSHKFRKYGSQVEPTLDTIFSVPKPKHNRVDTSWPNSVYDFDDYDTKVFQVPHTQTIQRRSLQRKKTNTISDLNCLPKIFRRQNSEPEIYQSNADSLTLQNSSLSSNGDKSTFDISAASSPAISIPNKRFQSTDCMYSSSFNSLNIEVKSKMDLSSKENSYFGDPYTRNPNKLQLSGTFSASPKEKKTIYARLAADCKLPSRALINPFDPSHAVIKLTSNRRRWTHIFPRGPSGALIQQHHFQPAYPKLEIVHEGVDPSENSKTDGGPRSSKTSANKQASETTGMQKLTLLWGATGEQEWSCALQTGVDWKSLTIPACLPITTDYFPDERSLQIDFLVSDYNLLPDDVNADYAQQKAIYRPPLTTKEVFEELVSQRLAQGFQLIVRPYPRKKPTKHSVKYSVNSSVSRTNVDKEKDKQEYLLSIGRVFHKISLDGSTINVTRYRPRLHAYPSISIHYRYQFHPPNSAGYEAASAEFVTEKLENYNWNYLDHYICTRGDKDFILVDPLKYWRFRMLLLPSFQTATKRIQDGIEHVNVYTSLTPYDKTSLVDSFIKFIEISINRRIRRNMSGKKSGRGFAPGVASNAQTFVERPVTGRLDRPRSRSISKGTDKYVAQKQEKCGRVSPTESLGVDKKNLSETSTEPINHIQTTPDSVEQYKLKANTLLSDITEAMRSPNSGFTFVKSDDLPKWTFVSSDACQWLMVNMEGVTSELNAVEKYNEILSKKFILHASGNATHPFLFGFYLYFIRSESEETAQKPLEDLSLFRTEWMEVNIELDNVPESSMPKYLENDVSHFTASNTVDVYRQVYVDVDLGKKSDRQEWGHIKYQSTYRPDRAFELVIQWVQSTGSVITELVQSWSRKAQQCNMQLIPIPNDPFALSSKSDPLRGPIFIPLNFECLEGNRSYLFEDFPEDTWSTRLFLLLDSILQQFGFIQMAASDIENRQTANDRHYYIHSSGNIFVFFQTNGLQTNESGKCQRLNESPVTGPQDDYITRHVTGKCRDVLQQEKRIGFFWAENYMSSSKRWKTSTTPALGDDSFVLKILKDFTAFCENQNNRLTTFWEANLKH